MRVFERLKRIARYMYLRVLRLRASAHSIALGLAVGIFIGFMPIVPLQTVAVLALAYLFRCNKFTAVMGTWISNPIDIVPFYWLLFYVGDQFVPESAVGFKAENVAGLNVLEMGWSVFSTMTVGGLIMGIPASIITYFVSRRMVEEYRRRKALRLLRRRTHPDAG
jgi:hypothetical protein